MFRCFLPQFCFLFLFLALAWIFLSLKCRIRSYVAWKDVQKCHQNLLFHTFATLHQILCPLLSDPICRIQIMPDTQAKQASRVTWNSLLPSIKSAGYSQSYAPCSALTSHLICRSSFAVAAEGITSSNLTCITIFIAGNSHISDCSARKRIMGCIVKLHVSTLMLGESVS